MTIPKEEITALLVRWSEGDERALELLIPLVYDELRLLARGFFKGERDGHTLQPTALVHDVWEKLANQREVSWQNRAQFFQFASTLMRRLLVDHARTRSAAKRGSGVAPGSLDDHDPLANDIDPVLILAVDEALERLADTDPRQARVVQMRYFIGLTVEEIAEAEGVAPSTVKRDWRTAKVWLLHELKGQPVA